MNKTIKFILYQKYFNSTVFNWALSAWMVTWNYAYNSSLDVQKVFPKFLTNIIFKPKNILLNFVLQNNVTSAFIFMVSLQWFPLVFDNFKIFQIDHWSRFKIYYKTKHMSTRKRRFDMFLIIDDNIHKNSGF